MYNTGVTPVPLELPLRAAEAAELAHLIFDQGERKSLTGEVRNGLAARAASLAVKWSRCLRVNEHLHEYIRLTRSAQKVARTFDFEPVLAGPALTTPPPTPQELLFCLHWLKTRGHAAQLAVPRLGFVEGRPYRAETVAEELLG
jgi:hypothetical protein